MHEKKNYPLYEVKPFGSIREMIIMAGTEDANRTAFLFRNGEETVSVTFGEFLTEVTALATAINEIAPDGAHVAMLGENRFEWILTYVSTLCSNAVFVPIDRELPPADIVNVVNDSDSVAVFVTGKYEQIIRDNRDALVNIKNVVCIDSNEDENGYFSYSAMRSHGHDLVNGGDTFFADRVPDTSLLKMLVYTSGTTGVAKGVMLSEHNLVSSVYYGLQVSDVYKRSLSVLPYNHTYEAVAGLLVSIHKRATICINENLKTVMKNLALYKPDYIYLVPAFAEEFYRRIWANVRKSGKDKALHALLKVSDGLMKVGIDQRKQMFSAIRDAFGGNLRKIVCGGAPIRPELANFFESIGIPLINGYGITECSPLVSANRDYFNYPETVGSVLPCVDIKIDRSAANPDETDPDAGEICVRGDIVMMGYYKRPDLTEKVMDEDGYFHTGDIGKMNENDLLMITGRIKNLIVLQNGKNIYPEEIESLIAAIPYVAEIIISSRKNENGEEVGLTAETFLREDTLKEMNITPELVQKRLEKDIANATSKLPIYKRPQEVKIRDIPFDKTTSNKIKRSY